jgi:3'-5' exoribonuclease
MHSAYRGGLLHHTLGVARTAVAIADSGAIAGINRDILLASAILHDIGKVDEYSMSVAGVPGRTPGGDLLGHIFTGAHRVMRVSKTPLAQAVAHCILSHHGTREWGSPVTPLAAEAIVLHFCDVMEARTEALKEAFAKLPDDAQQSEPMRILDNAKAYRLPFTPKTGT